MKQCSSCGGAWEPVCTYGRDTPKPGEKEREIANKLVGYLGIDLPENESTAMMLEYAYNRIVEAGYLLDQAAKALHNKESINEL